MKNLKRSVITLLLTVTVSVVFAQKPTEKKDFTINLSENVLKSISRDIVLTDSQMIALQISTKEYEVKMKDIKVQANSEVKKTKNKDAVLNYRAKLNQILTKEQLDTLQMKRMNRDIERINKSTNNN